MCGVCTPAPAHHPPRSHLGSPPGPRPQPIPARSRPAGCSRLHAEWGAPGTQAGMAVPVVPGFACKKKTRPATTRVAPPFSGFRRPRALRVGPVMATPASGTRFRTPPPLPLAIPRPACAAPRRAPSQHPSSHPSSPPPPPRNSRACLAPGSGRRSLSAPGARRFYPRLRKPPPPPGRALVPAWLPRQLRRHRRT